VCVCVSAYLCVCVRGEIVPQVDPQTVCDGLRTQLGSRTFPIVKELVHSIVSVCVRVCVMYA